LRTIQAVTVEEIDFSRYGLLFDLVSGAAPDVVAERSTDWQDRYTARPVVTGSARLGMTIGPTITTDITRLERHPHTREAVACICEPIVLPLAVDAGDRPSADSVIAVELRPGQCVSLHPGVWHGAGMGADEPTAYYWLAEVTEQDSSPWADILGGPIRIRGPHRGTHE
jgi:ureidoglycolate lyase